MNNIILLPKNLSLDCERFCDDKYKTDGTYYPIFLYKQFFLDSQVENLKAINKIEIILN